MFCQVLLAQTALLQEQKADEETCSSSSCDLMDSMSEPDAGGSGAGSPSLPAAIEQWEMLQTDVALHPSRSELHTFTFVVRGKAIAGLLLSL
jgi:hypothetical protein